MNAWLWACLGAFAAVVGEAGLRKNPDSYPWYLAIFSLVINYCLWKILREGSWLAGIIVWSTSMTIFRMVGCWVVGEPLTLGSWLALLLLCLASIVKKIW